MTKYTDARPDERDTSGKVCGKGQRTSLPSPGAVTPPAPPHIR